MMQSGDLLTVPKAAKALGYTKRTLYAWLKNGKLYAVRLGGILFVPASEIERLGGNHGLALGIENADNRGLDSGGGPQPPEPGRGTSI